MVARDFDKLLLEAVDEGLSSLGESVKQSIYFHLERSFQVKKEEIPDKIGTFTQAVENIFGPGAEFIVTLMVRRLYEKVGEAFDPQGSKGSGFREFVAFARRSFLERSRIQTIEELIECEEEKIQHS